MLELIKRNKWFVIAGSVILLLIIIFVWSDNEGGEKDLIVEVEDGPFAVTVTTTGELQAKNSEKIMGPSGLRQAGIWRVKITDIISEGSIVKKGDYIATLDRTEVSSKLKDIGSELEKTQSKYLQTKLDTTLELRKARDELINLKFAKEEREIELKQSKFEPPAIQRQAEISLDKARRGYEQALKNYEIKKDQSAAKMREVAASLQQFQNKYDFLQKLLGQFKIQAPKGGMLIYKKEWGGRKKTVGSTISPWDPVVATLPDLSRMISMTYVNEVDISKVKKGQEVKIGVDAFPERKYSGSVIDVANVGEELPETDAKVFEVIIELNEADTLLRPAMTTSNEILISQIDSVTHIPLEAVHSNDSISYVYMSSPSKVKKEVKAGKSNENHIIIEKGLKKGDEVFLNIPEGAEEWRVEKLTPGKS